MEGMSLTIVPVAHISRRSAELVKETIEMEKPQMVGLELCRERLEGLAKGGHRTMDIRTAFTHPTSALLFVAQQLLGKWWRIKPGAEMLEAIRASAEVNAPIVLMDRPIRAIARDIEKIPFREKFGMLFSGGMNPFKKIKLKDLMKPENLNKLLEKMEKDFPVSYKVFVGSRNSYMFRKLIYHKPESAVMVVGAAHVPGIMKLAEEHEEKINVKVVG